MSNLSNEETKEELQEIVKLLNDENFPISLFKMENTFIATEKLDAIQSKLRQLIKKL